jgi:hypothetical protein
VAVELRVKQRKRDSAGVELKLFGACYVDKLAKGGQRERL